MTSSRVPKKPLTKYCGKTQIELLIDNIKDTGYKIFVAVPESEIIDYSFLIDLYPKTVKLFSGFADDPLARMSACARENGVKNIIRITHDKVFINTQPLGFMVGRLVSDKLDYVYSSDFVAGSGFEIISAAALAAAANEFRNIEHISYAIKAITKKIYNYKILNSSSDVRLLIDYPQDVDLINVLVSTLGTQARYDDVIKLISRNTFLKKINALPFVTIYTCAYNSEQWIDEAMGSVGYQKGFPDYEYLLVDDYSSDKTLFKMAKFCHTHKNARFIKNNMNLGLASSSNVALKNARGKYIIRLDSDDFFLNKSVLSAMAEEIDKYGFDVLYPNCFAGLSMRKIQKGDENFHVGGAMFRSVAINHIKFTDGLRNHDSLDIFHKSKNQLHIGLYDRTTFCYRQHNRSMSKTNLDERRKTKAAIEEKYG